MIFGPTEASLGDWRLWYENEVEERLRELFGDDEDILYIYGDPTYSGIFGIIGAYTRKPGRPLTKDQEWFNRTISESRIIIEQFFGILVRDWSFNAYKHNLKIGKSPIAGIYMISVLLVNIRCCMSGNQISELFDIQPPTLDEYFIIIIQQDIRNTTETSDNTENDS